MGQDTDSPFVGNNVHTNLGDFKGFGMASELFIYESFFKTYHFIIFQNPDNNSPSLEIRLGINPDWVRLDYRSGSAEISKSLLESNVSITTIDSSFIVGNFSGTLSSGQIIEGEFQINFQNSNKIWELGGYSELWNHENSIYENTGFSITSDNKVELHQDDDSSVFHYRT